MIKKLKFQSFSKIIKSIGKKKSMDSIYGKNWEGLNIFSYEVLVHIFSFLDLSDIKNLKLVSKDFSNIASECCLWRMFLIKLHTDGKISPRVCHSAVVYKNLMYVYGGHLPDSHTFIKDVKSDLNTYDFEARKWNTLTTTGIKMPEKTEHSAVVYKNSMYIFGGYSGASSNYMDISIYKLDLDTLEGETLNGTGQKPMGRSAHSAVVWREYMYIFGGWDGTESNNSFYRLNLDSLEWSLVPAKGSPPPCIRSHSAVTHNDFLYIIGGYGPDGHTECPYSYDLANNQWVPMIMNNSNNNNNNGSTNKNSQEDGRGPCSRSRLRTVVYGNSLWCLGGWNRSCYYNDLWKFNLDTRQWSKINSSFELKGIGQYSVVTYRNQLYFYGGYNPTTSSPQPNVYTYIVEKDLERDSINNKKKILDSMEFDNDHKNLIINNNNSEFISSINISSTDNYNINNNSDNESQSIDNNFKNNNDNDDKQNSNIYNQNLSSVGIPTN
ncbi:hypothetical protein RB653_006475 [Dictyostelium firmibasis]|uniref:F-box domain-containing protein n=1 Tax=Dictyostelium firmibasis TaxID=79012 RepID=A0AAN7Z221_9MYCE